MKLAFSIHIKPFQCQLYTLYERDKFIHLISEIGKGKHADIEMLALTNISKFFIIDETSMISIDILYQFLRGILNFFSLNWKVLEGC